MAEKLVQYPELLDGFGKELGNVIGLMDRDKLKPALMSDIQKALASVAYTQQLLVMMYNLNVANHEMLAKRINEIENKGGEEKGGGEKQGELELGDVR